MSAERTDPLAATLSIEAIAATIPRTDLRVDGLALGRPTALARTQLAAGTAPELPRISLDEPGAARDDARDLEIVEELGRGGMGVVMRARQRSIDRDVAVKRPNGASHDDDAAAAALLYEARITGALEHPNIVPVHLLGRDRGGRPVIVMKRVVGTTWSALLRDPQHPRWADRAGDRLRFHVEILVQLCNAVAFAHAEGVVHRDIKPDNVMIGEFGEVYLLDWGIAVRKERQDEPSLAGTPAYMAPEMLALEPLDERTDVYLLGASLHEALTGRPRHTGTSVAEVLRSVVDSAPVTMGAEVPEELVALVNKATHRDRAQRFASAGELRRALEGFLVHRSSSELVARVTPALEALGAEHVALDVARVRFAECRFAFGSALQQWPDNAAARAGLRRAVHRMFDLELRSGNVDAAEALLAEAEAGQSRELRAHLESARAEREATVARLRDEVRQGDARVSARTRAIASAMIGVALFGGALLLGELSRRGVVEMSYATGIGFNAGAFVLVTAARPAIFRRVERTRYNLAMIDVLQAFVAGTVALRAAGWYLALPIVVELRLEAVASAIIHATIALTIDRKLMPAAAFAAVCAFASVVSPRFTFELVLLCQIGAFAWVIHSWYQRSVPPR